MCKRVYTESLKALKVEVLYVLGRWLHDYLELVIVLKTIRIFTIATVCRPSGGLNISHLPGLRAKHAQKCGRIKCAGANFYIIGLLNDAAFISPVFLER
jgi:hypothetical protein